MKEASDAFHLTAYLGAEVKKRGWGVLRRGVRLLARGRWHDHDDFDPPLPRCWTRVPHQHTRWVVRPKSVFSDGRDLVDRDVNCRTLDWKYDNFPVQEMARSKEFGPISLEQWLLAFTTPTTMRRPICSTNLLHFIPATSQNKTARFYKQQLKTWFRAGRRPWRRSLLSDGTIYGTEMKTSRNFLVQWPTTERFIKY